MKKLILLVLFWTNLALANTEIIRGPYLQRINQNSVIIRWRTNQPTDSVVKYGAKETDQKVAIDESTLEHRVEISDLKPTTKYFYSVGTSQTVLLESSPETFFKTFPVTGEEVDTRIWAIGDTGRANQGQLDAYNGYLKYVEKTKKNADVWLMLGDNAYETGKDHEYQKALFDVYQKTLRNTVLWPAYGNHDGYSASSATLSGPYFDNFSLPRHAEAGGIASDSESYYSFDHGQIHFICLNSFDTDRGADAHMANWLKKDLSFTKAKWKIAYWHHTPYSKGSHDSDIEIELLEMRKNIVPILEDAGVDLVLAGHSHAYERSMLINGHYDISTTLKPEMIVDNSSGENPPYTKKEGAKGTVYLTAGNGALIEENALNHPVIKVVKKELGSVVIDITKDKLTSKLINTKGEVLDTFSIIKIVTAKTK